MPSEAQRGWLLGLLEEKLEAWLLTQARLLELSGIIVCRFELGFASGCLRVKGLAPDIYEGPELQQERGGDTPSPPPPVFILPECSAFTAGFFSDFWLTSISIDEFVGGY